MAYLLSDLIGRVRTSTDDVAGDKSAFLEDLTQSPLGNQVNGANKTFQLANRRTISGTLKVSADGAAYADVTQTSAEALRGQFTLGSAPASTLLAMYDFQFLTDTEVSTFLTQAISFIDGLTDPTLVAAGLVDALVYKSASDACRALSVRLAPYYNASADGKSAEKGNISDKYAKLADALFKQAVAERAAFYGERKGQASSPAYGASALSFRPWTPRR